MRGNSTISNRCRCHRTAAVDHRTSCRWRPPYASRWKEQIRKEQEEDADKCCMKFQIEKERLDKFHEIFMLPGLSEEDKQKVYDEWLRNFYEPVRNGLL